MRKNVTGFAFQVAVLLFSCGGFSSAFVSAAYPQLRSNLVQSTSTTNSLSRRSSGVLAEAYECDESFKALSLEREARQAPRIGYEIRVCVRPILTSTMTLPQGVVMRMRSIDDFTWSSTTIAGSSSSSRPPIVQPAIRDGYDQPRTVQVCISGRPICSFKTQLIHDFFFYEGDQPSNLTTVTVLGTGSVSMEVVNTTSLVDIPPNQRNLAMDDEGDLLHAVVQWVGSSGRALQAGSSTAAQDDDNHAFVEQESNVKVTLNVKAYPHPHDFVPLGQSEEDATTRWWQDSPSWAKALIIGITVILFLIGCCACFLGIWIIQDRIEVRAESGKKRKNQEEKENEEPTGAVVHVHQRIDERDSHLEIKDSSSAKDEPTSPPQVCFVPEEDHTSTTAAGTVVRVTHSKHWRHAVSPEPCRPSTDS